MLPTTGSPAHAQAVPRCVLLIGESGAVPSSLVGALDRRGLEIVIVRQPPQVMAELALVVAGTRHPATPDAAAAQEADAGRQTSAAPGDPAPGLSLVIVEPQQQPRLEELRDALAAYYPAVRCWQYLAHGPEDRPRLEALTLDNLHHRTADPREPASTTPSTPAIPPQDFVDTGESKPHTSNTDPAYPRDTARVKGSSQRLRSLVVQIDEPRPPDDGPLVSEEELAMLLGPDPQPASGHSISSRDPADASAPLGISPDSRHPDGERE